MARGAFGVPRAHLIFWKISSIYDFSFATFDFFYKTVPQCANFFVLLYFLAFFNLSAFFFLDDGLF